MAYAKDVAGLGSFYEKKKNPYLLNDDGSFVLNKKGKPVENPYTDPHTVAAMGLCPALKNYPPELIREMAEKGHCDVDYRFRGKILNFSVIYGKTEQGLSDDLKCSVEEAAKVLHSYFSQYFGLKAWLDKSAKQASRNKRIKLPTGRWLWVDESNSKGNDQSAERKGPNGYVQGFCADQLKVTLPIVRKYLEEVNNKYNIRNNIVALIHDEIVYELHKDSAEEVGNELRELMENIQGDMLKKYFDCETGGFSSLTIAPCWKK